MCARPTTVYMLTRNIRGFLLLSWHVLAHMDQHKKQHKEMLTLVMWFTDFKEDQIEKKHQKTKLFDKQAKQ